MGLAILDRKPTFRKDGELILDLTYISVKYDYAPDIVDYVLVNESTEMRPDLLSRQAYGTLLNWDVLFKYNGISNPYSVEKSDILFVPSLEQMNDQLSTDATENSSVDSIRKQYVDVSKKAKEDPKLAEIEKKRRAALQAKVAKNKSISNLPPNVAEEGSKEVVIKGGKIFFGPDVSKPAHECSQPLSKSEFIARLIKNRIVQK